MPRHVRKGDQVIITAGKFRGKTGEIVQVNGDSDRVIVRGPEIEGVTKAIRPTQANPQGGQTQIDRSFHISNVSPVVDGKPSRVRFETRADGSKVRVAVRSGKVLHELKKATKK